MVRRKLAPDARPTLLSRYSYVKLSSPTFIKTYPRTIELMFNHRLSRSRAAKESVSRYLSSVVRQRDNSDQPEMESESNLLRRSSRVPASISPISSGENLPQLREIRFSFSFLFTMYDLIDTVDRKFIHRTGELLLETRVKAKERNANVDTCAR